MFCLFTRACPRSWVLQSSSVSHKQQTLCSSLHYLQNTQRDWNHTKLYPVKRDAISNELESIPMVDSMKLHCLTPANRLECCPWAKNFFDPICIWACLLKRDMSRNVTLQTIALCWSKTVVCTMQDYQDRVVFFSIISRYPVF